MVVGGGRSVGFPPCSVSQLYPAPPHPFFSPLFPDRHPQFPTTKPPKACQKHLNGASPKPKPRRKRFPTGWTAVRSSEQLMARDFPVKDTLRANLRANFKLSSNFHILLYPIQIHGRGNVLFCPNIFNAIEQHLLILAGRWILRMNMYEMEREKKSS